MSKISAPSILTTADNQAYTDLQKLMKEPKVECLMEELRIKYPELRAHSQTTAYFALMLDGDFSYDYRMHLGMGALLHDVGKYPDKDFFISRELYTTPEQHERKRAHARLGFYITKKMGYEIPAAILVGDQEWIASDRYPRSGIDRRKAYPSLDIKFPTPRSGKERRTSDPFLLAAQQRCAIADVVVAMLEGNESRPYRPNPMKLGEIENHLEKQFLGDSELIAKAIRIAERATLVF